MKQQTAGPTLDELHQAFKDGGTEKVGRLMIVDGRKMIPSPKDLTLAYQMGGQEFLEALMSNMDGDEPEDSDPGWDERRWR